MKIVLLAVVLFYSQFPTAFGAQTCDVDASPRKDCGYFGITLEECIVTRQCCWDPKENEPWCFSGTPVEGSTAECRPEHGAPRIDCGYLGIDQAGCEKRGCCYSPADNPKTPWCFKKTITTPPPPIGQPVCSPDKPRNDCGYFGITQQLCEEQDCCWAPAFNLPWCFNATVPLSDENCIATSDKREDCGFIGITVEECEGNGCCWDPAYNEPWCFFKAQDENGVSEEPAAVRQEDEEPVPPEEPIDKPAPPEEPTDKPAPPEEPVAEEPVDELQCSPDKPRVDCGYYGVTEEECEESGCCWTPDFEFGLPWCYKKSSVLTDPLCIAASQDRTDCGYYGIGQEECEEKQCCWSPENNQPWCFLKFTLAPPPEDGPAPSEPDMMAHIVEEEPAVEKPTEPVTPVAEEPLEQCLPDKPRIDCGYYGITQEECEEKKGCCWTPEYVYDLPWCYEQTSLLTDEACIAGAQDRIDCGYYGIDKKECEEKDCCWNPEYGNQPWCFFKGAVTTVEPEPVAETPPPEDTASEEPIDGTLQEILEELVEAIKEKMQD